jgi:hypothetical protein
MGLKIGFSSCSCDNHDCGGTTKTKIIDRNPDPSLFTIKSLHFINGYTIAVVVYPNCINFEGKKVLAFEGDLINRLTASKKIDPHFFDSRLSPVARFSPNIKGLQALSRMLDSSVTEIMIKL